MTYEVVEVNTKVIYIPTKRLNQIYISCNAYSQLIKIQSEARYGIVVSWDFGELCYNVTWYDKNHNNLITTYITKENIEPYYTNKKEE